MLQQCREAQTREEIRKAFKVLFAGIEGLIREEDYEGLDSVVASMSMLADKMAPMLLIAVLRLTVWHRELLPSWGNSLARIERSLTSRGKDASILLDGLE